MFDLDKNSLNDGVIYMQGDIFNNRNKYLFSFARFIFGEMVDNNKPVFTTL
jgi:hypothetical protein